MPHNRRMRVHSQTYELVPLDRLKHYPRNVNEGDVGAISESIEDNGLYGAVLAQRSTGYVLKGNHTLQAARQKHREALLKKEHSAGVIPCLWVDVTDEEARRIVLADNQTARRGRWDEMGLLAELEDIHASSGTLAGTGFDEVEWAEMAASFSAMWVDPAARLPKGTLGDDDPEPEVTQVRAAGPPPLTDAEEAGMTLGSGRKRLSLNLLNPDDHGTLVSAIERALERQGRQLPHSARKAAQRPASEEDGPYSPYTVGLLALAVHYLETVEPPELASPDPGPPPPRPSKPVPQPEPEGWGNDGGFDLNDFDGEEDVPF